MSADPPVRVWFVGGCPPCRRGAIAFVDVSEAVAGCPVERAELLRRLHAQEAGRSVVSGAAAFAAVWRAVPLLRPFGLMAQCPPDLSLLEAACTAFLRVRPALQAWAR